MLSQNNDGPPLRASAQSCTPPVSGLVAWWPAEGNAYDTNGGNNGTVEQGVTFGPGEALQAFPLTKTCEEVT